MASSFQALADLVKVNDANNYEIEVSDLVQRAPLLAALAADGSSNGTNHTYIKETGAPTVGFRLPNAGRDLSKSSDTQVTIALKILDASFAIDQAIADAYQKGPEAYVAREALRHMRASFALAERQIINGDGSNGFTGLAQALTGTSNAMCITAGTGGSGNNSSIYLIRTNGDGTDCQVVMANDMALQMKDTIVQDIVDGSGGHYPAYYTSILGWLGLQIGSAFSVARIGNVLTHTGSTNKATDTLIANGIKLFPEDRQPDLIVMNKAALFDLRASRTATNATGAPAPIPTEAFGIPIITTSSVLTTEAAIT